MTDDHAMQALLARDYPVELRMRGDRYYLTQGDLGLAASGESLEAAWASYDEGRRRLFRHHLDLGTADGLRLPRDQALKRQMMPFLLKTAAITLAGVMLLVTASVSFTYALHEPLRKVAQRATRVVTASVVAEIKDTAAKDFPPDRQMEIREAIRGAVPHIKPFADELKPLFLDPPASSAKQR